MHGAINIRLWFVFLVKDQEGKGGRKGKVQIVCPHKGHSTQQVGELEAHTLSNEIGQLHTSFLHFKTESMAEMRMSRNREINVETGVVSCSHKRPGYTYRAFLMTVI